MLRRFTPKGLSLSVLAAALASCPTAAQAQDPAVEQTVDATLHADQPGPQFNRQIFGQFAEHHGHGIYGGIWVGEKSPIPNDNGYRTDVLQALKAINVPMVRWWRYPAPVSWRWPTTSVVSASATSCRTAR